MSKQQTPERAREDLQHYARAMRTGNDTKAADIEQWWGLYGYMPEIVSTVLACVATGLTLDAAVNEATS